MNNSRCGVSDGCQPAASGWQTRNPTATEMAELTKEFEMDEQRLAEEVSDEYGFVRSILIQERLDDCTTAKRWEWERYQRRYMCHRGNYATNKCRQSGGSAGLSVKKTARACLAEDKYTAIIVSYKKEEAIGKIDYVRSYMRALPPHFEKKIIRDPRQLLEWENPNGTRSVIMSHAQKPVRGSSAEVALDEFAIYQFAEEIYESALPVVSQCDGDIDVISTPLGKGGPFYEIIQGSRGKFTVESIWWWLCKRYLKDGSTKFMGTAAALAHTTLFPTPMDRVLAFGNKRILHQLENSKMVSSFMQEFEGYFIDGEISFFSRDLLVGCSYNHHTDMDDYGVEVASDFVEGWDRERAFKDISVEEAGGVSKLMAKSIEFKYQNRISVDGRAIKFKKYVSDHSRKSKRFGSWKDLVNAVYTGEISDNLYVGLDIGYSNHSTDLRVIEEIPLAGGGLVQIERASMSIEGGAMSLPKQHRRLQKVLDYIPWREGLGDEGGVGAEICQEFEERYKGRFNTINFSGGGASKVEPLMVNARHRFETRTLAINSDTSVIDEFHGVQRIITDGKRISYKAPEKNGTHADSCFAFIMASWSGTRYSEKESLFDLTSVGIEAETFEEYESRNEDVLKMTSFGNMKVPMGGSFFENLMSSDDAMAVDNFLSNWDQ